MNTLFPRYLLLLMIMLTPMGTAAQALSLKQTDLINAHIETPIAEQWVFLTCMLPTFRQGLI